MIIGMVLVDDIFEKTTAVRPTEGSICRKRKRWPLDTCSFTEVKKQI